MRWTPDGSESPHQGISPAFWLTLATLTTCVVFGGASRNNIWPATGLALASLPLLAQSLWRLLSDGGWRNIRLPLLFMIFLALTPLLQLIPLPFEVWASLPGREAPAEAQRLAGAKAWMPFSLDPGGGVRAILYLAPPLAIFLGVVCLAQHERRRLLLTIPIIATVSLVLGSAQAVAGEDSFLYFYGDANSDSAPGFFANRNHQATLFVCSIPMIAGWLASRTGRIQDRILSSLAAVAMLMLMILGLTVVKSRAGILLLAPAIISALALLWVGERSERRASVLAIAVLGLGVGAALSFFAMHPLLERFVTDAGQDGRFYVTPATLRAGLDYLPFGSGLGTFTPIYASLEPVDQMGPAFWNHAHNDYAELWLETGVLAPLGLGLFLIWWLATMIRTLRQRPDNEFQAWTGATVTLLIMAHSAVDYPLRTLALACVFAMACGLMTSAQAAPLPREERRRVKVKTRIANATGETMPQLERASRSQGE